MTAAASARPRAPAPRPSPTFGFGPGFQPQQLPARLAPYRPRTRERVVYFHVNPGVNVTFQVGDATHLIQGPVTVPMVSTNSSQPIQVPVQVPPGHVLQQIVDESGTLRHVILSPQPAVPQHLPPHIQHGPPPPPQHYGPVNGGNPQQYYGPPAYPPPHFHPHQIPQPPQHAQPHIPHIQPSYLKSERAQRQHCKLKRKLEQRSNETRNNNLGFNSSHSTPAPSPRKECSNGMRGRGPGSGVGGTSSEGEGSSSAATSVQGDEEDAQPVLDFLATVKSPQVSEITSRCALVQWNAPTAVEGSAPPLLNGEINYQLLLGEKGRYKAIYCGPALSCRVRDLRPGTDYAVCVQAHVDGLVGAASDAAAVRTPACEPSAPAQLRAVNRGKNSLQLRWNAANDNGSSILSYILQYDEGKGGEFVDFIKPRNRSQLIQKLEESTRYRFRLAAINEVGQGPWTDEVCFSTCGSPPPAPEPPVLVHAAPKSLVLQWDRRPGDEEFSLQMEDEDSRHGFLAVYAGPNTKYSCENLVRCTDYKFRLLARNEEGESRWSEEVKYRTLADRPNAPMKPSVKGKIHAQSFRVRWEPPGDKGGTEIQSYTLEINSGNGFEAAYVGSEQEATCDRLTPGCCYQVRVSCKTVGGVSNWSDIQTITTEPVVPGVCLPPTLTSEPRPFSLDIKWQKPDYDGGSPVLEYNIEVCDDENSRLVYKGKETECTVQDLLPGRQYSVKVKAFNRVGGGPWSEALLVISGAAPPDIPNQPKAIAKSPYNILVQWEEPKCNGGPIIDYQLDMSIMSKDESTYLPVYQGSNLSCDVKNLIPFTSYFFKICASNKAGTSKWSDVSEISTPGAPPGAPPSVNAEATATEALLAWPEPACNGYPIQHYRIDLGEKVIVTEEPILEYLLKGLLPETAYRIRIQAVNEIGIGNYSPTLKVETLPLPPAPPLISCVQQGHNFLKLKWGEGKNTDFTQYIVEMQNPRRKDYQCVYEGTSFTFRVKKLQESTKYRFRICASNDAAGQGEFSEDFEFETTAAPPATLKIPRQVELTDHSLNIEWSSSKVSDEPLIYIVQCCRTKDQDYKQVYKGPETTTTIEDLESGCEYSLRVCAEREVDGTILHGAWSPALLVPIPAIPILPPVVSPCPGPRRTPRRAVATFLMSDNHYAFIIIFGFFVVSVIAANCIKQFIDA